MLIGVDLLSNKNLFNLPEIQKNNIIFKQFSNRLHKLYFSN